MTGDQFFEKGSLANENQMQRGDFGQGGDAGRNNAVGTEVPTHGIYSNDQSGQGLLVGALVDDFATTIETVRRHVVAQMHFASALLDRQSIGFESVVGATHVACGTGFFVLLNSQVGGQAVLGRQL